MARPAHKPTAATRRQVAAAAGGGMRQEDIANGIGITVPTLRKHYSAELSAGAARERMAVLAKVLAQAKKGSTSAARLYLQQVPTSVADPEEGGNPKLGKKEKAQVDAKTAAKGTEWDDLIGSGANVTPIRKAS